MTRQKHLRLDQTKIDRAKKLLGAKTEKAHRRAKGVSGFEDAFR